MKKLNGAIIGLGKMGLVHYGILNTHPNVEVKCLCDTQQSLLHYIKKENDSIHIYTDYKEMLNKEKLDFVIISTPANHHHEIINASLDQQIHIFVEKPFTINEEEGQRVINRLISSNKKLVCQVGYVSRYQEIFSEVKNMLDENVLGEIFLFNIEMFSGMVKNKKQLVKSWRSQKNIAGGGCLIEFTSNAIDLMVWYFGMPKSINEVILKKIYSTEVEDYCHASFLYDKQIFGTLTSTWSDPTYRLPLINCQIIGENGKIIAQEHELKIYLSKKNGLFIQGWNNIYLPDIAKTVRFDLAGSLFTLQIDDFIKNILNNNSFNQNSFESAFKTTQLIEKIYHLGTIL